MNKINYCSIITESNKISVCIFKGKELEFYEEKYLTYGESLYQINEYLEEKIKTYKIDMVITNHTDFETIMKKDLIQLIKNETIIEFTSEKNKAVFVKFRVLGWEKRLLANRPTNNAKISYINTMYDLNLTKEQIGLANAIILAEGVSHNRLQVGSI